MRIVLDLVAQHSLASTVVAALVLVYLVGQVIVIRRNGPRDITGNGIVVGKPKAFDNRSLALRIERLSASLATLKVVNQNVTDNAVNLQGVISSESTRSLTATLQSAAKSVRAPGGAAGAESSAPDAATGTAATADAKPAVGLAAGDILSDQLNLASQIVNLETLYERSLTDRLIQNETRLQTVLGFQISITPPSGFENCVAVAEVGVRVRGSDEPVSLVALIPQEKTYNAQSISTNTKSIGGSAVASVVTLGLTSKGESRQLFIHRDSDTIAFERVSGSTPRLFADNAAGTVFGWEFRPVLGRTTVSAGTRQLLAVIAVPAAETAAPDEVVLEVVARSYWRRYDRGRQTTRPRFRLWRVKADGSSRVDSPIHQLAVPNTAKIQEALAPKVTSINWVNSGAERATVIVKGANFFSGTKVVIGGVVHREEDGSLTLKSDQALEFDSPIASLATGDSVLSGRFGSSFQLAVPPAVRPVYGLRIAKASIRPSRYTRSFRISIQVKGMNADGGDENLTVDQLAKLPDGILFAGTDPLPMPYDYLDITEGAAKSVIVEAWVPAQTLTRSPSVAFRVPFCGSDYQASQPLSFSEPSVTRMGSDGVTTLFRIANPVGFSNSIQIDIDRPYVEGVELTRTSAVDYQLSVPNLIVSKYRNLVIRMGTAEPYVLPIPGEEKPQPKPAIRGGKPQQITKGALGPVEWSGTALDAVTAVLLHTALPPAAGVPATFSTYEDGEKIVVYFAAGSTGTLGKAEVEFQTAAPESFRVALFITA